MSAAEERGVTGCIDEPGGQNWQMADQGDSALTNGLGT